MSIPEIESQVRRDAGGSAEATDFGSVHWVVRENSPEGAEQTLGIAIFDAGKGKAEHTHPNCEEIVLVMEGEVEHTLGDQRTTLRAGDLIVVPRDVPHRHVNRGDALVRACIIFSAPDRQFIPTGRTDA